MAFKITGDCINCGVCKVECPFGAILQGGINWRKKYDQSFMYNDVPAFKDPFYSDTIYYVVPDLCNECKDYYSEPQCVMICPMGSVVRDEMACSAGNGFICRDEVFNPLFSYSNVN